MKRLAAIVILSGGIAPFSTISAQPAPTSVYVFTAVASPDAPTPIEAERVALVQSLKKGLPNNKKISDQVTVSESKDTATIAVEVISADQIDRLLPSSGGNTIVSPSYRAHVKLTFGTYATDFNAFTHQETYRLSMGASMRGPLLTLMRIDASVDLAGKIREWITANLDDIRKK